MNASGTPVASIGSAVLIAIWAACGPVFHYSETWQLVINAKDELMDLERLDQKELDRIRDEYVRRAEFARKGQSVEARLSGQGRPVSLSRCFVSGKMTWTVTFTDRWTRPLLFRLRPSIPMPQKA